MPELSEVDLVPPHIIFQSLVDLLSAVGNPFLAPLNLKNRLR